MFEIVKKANRFTNDPPEVIAYADSRSEAEALARDYQAHYFGRTAYVTFRRAGEGSVEPTVPGSDFNIAYCDMAIEGFEGERFVVAKLRRVSSPPVQVGTVSDPQASALGRLVDIIRLGRLSRNYLNLRTIEWLLKEDFQTVAETEWGEYEKVICRVLGVGHLEPLSPTTPPAFGVELLLPGVTFHRAEMNTLPYLVARVGTVFGSPAAEYLTHPYERDSALERLRDVFRVGVRGRAFRDFVEAGRKLGKSEAEIVRQWRELSAIAGNGTT